MYPMKANINTPLCCIFLLDKEIMLNNAFSLKQGPGILRDKTMEAAFICIFDDIKQHYYTHQGDKNHCLKNLDTISL